MTNLPKGAIIVKPIECETKSKLGIILEQKVKMYQNGLVEKVGDLENDIKVGDKLIYANNIQTNVTYKEEKCHLITEEFVLATYG